MLNNSSHVQVDNSTFTNVGRDQYNAGRDQYHIHYDISTVTGMIRLLNIWRFS